MSRPLWFTSATSTNMNNEDVTTFAGLYSCTLDEKTGRCDDYKTVADTLVKKGGGTRRGLDLSNVVLNDAKTRLYAGWFTGNIHFEILRASLDDSERLLQSYFRIDKEFNKNRGASLQNCDLSGPKYQYKDLLPVGFLVDQDEHVFISWEGYFQDCEDPDEIDKGLVWSIGVSQVDPACIMKDEVSNFAECTSLKSVFYRGFYGKDRRLASGFAISTSPANRRLFYLTVQDRSSSDEGGMNKIWVVPEGIHMRPTTLVTPDVPTIWGFFGTRIIRDVSTLRLWLDENGIPRSLCRTAYDQGVYCHKIVLEDDGDTIDLRADDDEESLLSIGPDQVAESCTISESNQYTLEKQMSPMTTGLEVVWGDDGTPEMLVFGCWGQLGGRGNMTTAFRNGTTLQTISGAYPGSILTGIDVPELDNVSGDSLANITHQDDVKSNDDDNLGRPLKVSLFSLLILVLLGFVIGQKRRRRRQSFGRSTTFEISGSQTPVVEVNNCCANGSDCGVDNTTTTTKLDDTIGQLESEGTELSVAVEANRNINGMELPAVVEVNQNDFVPNDNSAIV